MSRLLGCGLSLSLRSYTDEGMFFMYLMFFCIDLEFLSPPAGIPSFALPSVLLTNLTVT